MTRAEYEAKYGQTPNAAPTSTQPVQMTRAEYQSKYGGATQTPQTPSSYKQGSVVQDFAKAVVDPLTKAGTSISKAMLPKALEPKYAQGGSVPSVFGGKDVDLVGYRDGQKLQGKELAKDIGGTALEVASYAPIARGAAIVQKGIGGAAAKVGQLAKEFGVAGALQGAGSEYQKGGTTGEALSQGLTTGAISTVAGPIIGKGAELAGRAGSSMVKKATDPVKYYTDSAKANALKAVNVIGGVKPADMSKIKDKAYRALSVIKKVNPEVKKGEIDVPLDIKNSDTPYLDVNDALVKTRNRVYEGIRDAYKEATGQGLTISPSSVIDELRTIYNNPANAIEKRNKALALRDELLGMTDKDGNIPIENIETFTPQLNARARPGFGNSSALGAQLDKDFSIKLSNIVDDAVEKIGIPQLRDLKDDYSSLKAIEKYILNEAKKEARRLDTSIAANIGDVGSAEILSGIVNAFRAAGGDAQAAGSLARGVALKAFSKMRQAAGDRANYLRKAFDDIDEINRQGVREVPVAAPKPVETKKKVDSLPPVPSLPRKTTSSLNDVPTIEDIRLAEDFLNSQPNATIEADQIKAKELLSGLNAQLEALDSMDSMKALGKFVGKRGEFKGELNLNNGSGKFGREGDTILREAVPGSQGKSAEELAGKYSSWASSKQAIKENMDSLKKFLRQSPRGFVDLNAEIFPKKTATPAYKETGDLTTKILKSLEGKSTVSKQFILDATNRGELKQVERDLFRKLVADEPNTIDVAKFANKVKAELLPLERKAVGEGKDLSKYESISLPDGVRGNVKNYTENIYASPIKTSAGNVHFGGSKAGENYFGHTRVEDMADNKTRRVIEVQSDLYQKGRLGQETNNYGTDLTLAEKRYRENTGMQADKPLDTIDRNRINDLVQKNKDVEKLSQYNDPTAHFRMIREEIKKAAEDGKTKLQFPTGATAMKIEGLGQNGTGFYNVNGSGFSTTYLQPSDLGVGKEIKTSVGNEKWIITDVLGDGKFKAVQKDRYDAINAPDYYGDKSIPDNIKETFDISGKVDTNNPIYKFYNKEVRNYLNKFGGKEVTDDKGVSWVEIPIGKNSKGAVEAFGLLGAVGLSAAASGNQKANAMSTQDMPLLGSPQEDKQEAFMKPGRLVEKKGTSTEDLKKALANNETGGVKNPYSLRKFSGSTKYGEDLGKYQITTARLSEKSKDFLGRKVTPDEFIANPSLQDRFIDAQIKWQKENGLSDKEILATHRHGWGNMKPEQLKKAVSAREEYIKKALEYIK